MILLLRLKYYCTSYYYCQCVQLGNSVRRTTRDTHTHASTASSRTGVGHLYNASQSWNRTSRRRLRWNHFEHAPRHAQQQTAAAAHPWYPDDHPAVASGVASGAAATLTSSHNGRCAWVPRRQRRICAPTTPRRHRPPRCGSHRGRAADQPAASSRPPPSSARKSLWGSILVGGGVEFVVCGVESQQTVGGGTFSERTAAQGGGGEERRRRPTFRTSAASWGFLRGSSCAASQCVLLV